MNEAHFWNRVRKAINDTPHAHTWKLTDAFTAGTPDALYCVNGITGVLELKYVPAWPTREATLITVGVTAEQRRWLETMAQVGGRAHVLLGVGQEWFLLELSEVPPADPPALPRMSRVQLDMVRRQGRSGTLRELRPKLAGVLAAIPVPVVD